MKKFLSLVLALVMTMSLVTISAGAKDFTDDSKINYEEAVDVMSALKVIDGYEDGSFNPQGSLTRGAAAKIICNLILGPTTAAALSADTAPYKDVPVNHTFAGYIAYCQQQGIISGYADGTFRPAATLTNYAFLKMLLGALGYDSSIEGYIGDNWSIQVAKRALAIGLTDGLDGTLNGTDYATREQACLYALNTLKATMVDYDAKITATVNGAQVTVGNSLANDVAWNIASKTDGNIKDDDYVQFAEKYFPNLELEIGNGIYGRPANIWKLKKAEIGTYTSIEPTYVYTESVDSDEVYKDLGKTVVTEYDWEAYVNGVEQKKAVLPDKDDDDEYVYTGEGTVTEIYVEDANKDKDDGKVTVVEINYYIGQVNKVKEDNDGEYITVSVLSKGAKGLNDKTFYVAGYDVDDYVVFTIDENEDEELVIGEVFEPETVTAEVTRVDKDTNTQNSKVTGETYLRTSDGKYVYTEDVNDPAQQSHIVYDLDGTIGAKVHPELNTEYIIYLDPNGYVLAFEKAEETIDQYLYVDDSDEEMQDWRAKVWLSDGTKATIDVEEDLVGTPAYGTAVDRPYPTVKSGTAHKAQFQDGEVNWIVDSTGVTSPTKDVTNIEGMIWKYSVDKDGVYELTYIPVNAISQPKEATQYAMTNATIKNDRAYVTSNDKSLIVDKKTVFVDTDSKTIYTGYEEVPNVDNAELAYVLDGKVADVVFILDGDIYDEASVYFMLAKTDRESLEYDDKDYWDYEKAYVNGEKVSHLYVAYYADPSNPNKVLKAADTLYKVTKTVDEEYIKEVDEVTFTNEQAKCTVVEVGVDAFWLDNSYYSNEYEKKFDVNNETVFVVVERNLKKDGVTLDSYEIYEGSLDDMDDDDYSTQVAVIKQDEQTAKLVYIFRDEIPNVASITSIQVASGVSSKGYSTIAEAVANPVVVDNMDSVDIVVSGAGTMSEQIWDKVATTDTKESDLTGTTSTNPTGWQYNAANNLYLVKATATSASGDKEVTRYVAVKPTAQVTITLDTITNARVEYNGKVMKVNDTIKVAVNDVITIKVTPADGTTTTTVTYNSTAQTGFSGVYDITANATANLSVSCS